MNKTAIKLWVEALRSGKYEQGQDKLNINNDYFCCLGVACEIYMEDHDDLTKKSRNLFDDDNTISYDFGGPTAETFVLPPNVETWLGGTEIDTDIFATLTNMNDNGYSFAEIADHIEQTLLSDS